MIPQLLGGVGLFLLGVFLMTDGLKTAAGAALRRILVRFTGHPSTAFASGVGITTLVQSSSATTLATIGFVSAGILTFSQAVGVVMGAALGTTTTGWLVALVGLQFGIGKLALPVVGLGALARLVSRGRSAAVALSVAGFGLMFVGIDILQTGMAGLSGWLKPDSLPHGNPWGGVWLVGIGIALTLVTQSSAAAVATTLAAFHAGMIDLEQGSCLVIGASIGTTSTSALAAIGATTPAKRTALAHILFSLMAGLLAFLLIPLFVWCVKLVEQKMGFQFGAVILAAFHSGFTLLAALLILPGVKRFSALMERLIPDRGPTLTRHLDASLVEVPDVAMEAMRRTLMEVATGILNGVEHRLCGIEDSRGGQIDEAVAALKESRRFLGTISFSASQPDQISSRISIIHALDHLNQLATVVTNSPDPSLLHDEPRVQSPKRMALELVDTATAALRQHALIAARETLERLSRTLAECRRDERLALLEESAHGSTETGRSLQTLDALRWLDAVGYHIWRALHHLTTDGNGADDERVANGGHQSFAVE